MTLLWFRTGDYKGAIELTHKACAICTTVFGREHPTSLHALDSLQNDIEHVSCAPEARAIGALVGEGLLRPPSAPGQLPLASAVAVEAVAVKGATSVQARAELATDGEEAAVTMDGKDEEQCQERWADGTPIFVLDYCRGTGLYKVLRTHHYGMHLVVEHLPPPNCCPPVVQIEAETTEPTTASTATSGDGQDSSATDAGTGDNSTDEGRGPSNDGDDNGNIRMGATPCAIGSNGSTVQKPAQSIRYSLATFCPQHMGFQGRLVTAAPELGDSELTNADAIRGNVCVFKRGAATFEQKAKRAQAAGAVVGISFTQLACRCSLDALVARPLNASRAFASPW